MIQQPGTSSPPSRLKRSSESWAGVEKRSSESWAGVENETRTGVGLVSCSQTSETTVLVTRKKSRSQAEEKEHLVQTVCACT